MTHALRSDSPRRIYALRFGKLLRETLTERGIGEKRVVAVIGGSRSTLRQYLAGYNLPSMRRAMALAAALDEPRLVAICRQGRTRDCNMCGKPYVDENGSPSRYCSNKCTLAARKVRARPTTERYYDALNAQRERDALDAMLGGYHAAITAMCRACEPEGVCRTADCPLRPVSPLPLLDGKVKLATPAPGPYGSPENRARTLAAIRAHNAKRWADPAERERFAELSRRLHAEGRIPARGQGKANR